MAKVEIAKLSIDVSELIKSTADVKKAYDDLQKEQKELKANGQESSKQFVENAAKLKILSSEYNAGVKALADYNTKLVDAENRTKLLDVALNAEVTTINQARQANSLLTKLRNEANATTSEGAKEIQRLNNAINANNDFINDNADANLKNKMNVGNYTQSIKDALMQNQLFGGHLQGLNGVVTSFSGVWGNAKNEFASGASLIKNAGAETAGLTGAQKALAIATNAGSGAMKILKVAIASTGIGLLVIAVGLLATGLMKFTPLMDKLEQVFAGVGAAISVVQRTMVSFVTNIKSVGDAVNKLGSFLKDPIGSFKKLGDEMEKAAVEAANLKKAQQDLEDSMRAQEVLNAKASQQYNELIVKSKNRTLSERERIAFLQEAESVEKKNFDERTKLAKEQEALAIREIANIQGVTKADIESLKARGVSAAFEIQDRIGLEDDLIDKLKDAQLATIAIQDESTKRLEKAQNAQDALAEKAQQEAEKRRQKEIEAQRKAEEQRQAILDEALARSQADLNLFISQQGERAKSLQETLKITEEVYQKEIDIAQKTFDASKKTEVDKLNLQTALNDARNKLLNEQADAVISNAQHELDIYIQTNKSKIDANKFLTEELVAEEKVRLELLANERRDFEALRLQEGQINQQQYNDSINAINLENETKLKTLEEERKQAEIEKQAIDLENKILLNQADLDLQLQQLEAKRLQEVASAKQTGAEIDLINQKYKNAAINLSNQEKAGKIANAQTTIGTIGQLAQGFFGENKLLAAAFAAMDAILGAQKAYLSQLVAGDPTSLPRAIGAAVQAGAFGALNVAKIAGVNPKFADGGIQEIGGKRHSAGGTKFYGEDGTTFEAEAGEGIGILNRGAFGAFMNFNNAFRGGKSTSGFFQGGGIITQSVAKQSLNPNELVSATVEAVRNLPPFYVAVDEINAGQKNYAEVVNGANF